MDAWHESRCVSTMTVAPHVIRIFVSPISLLPNVYKRFFFLEVVPLANDDTRRRHKVVTDVVTTFWRDSLSLPARKMLCLLMQSPELTIKGSLWKYEKKLPSESLSWKIFNRKRCHYHVNTFLKSNILLYKKLPLKIVHFLLSKLKKNFPSVL